VGQLYIKDSYARTDDIYSLTMYISSVVIDGGPGAGGVLILIYQMLKLKQMQNNLSTTFYSQKNERKNPL